jgi:CDP-glycerol glycerophosphotransferase
MTVPKKIFRKIASIFFVPLWFLELLIPRNKNLWVFGSWFGRNYSDNSRALYEFMLANHPEYRCVWITKNPAIYQRLITEKKPVAMANSLKGIRACLCASLAITSSSNVDLNGYCLNGGKRIWLWHGMPLKKILNDDNFSNSWGRPGGRLVKTLSKAAGVVKSWNKPAPALTITSSPYFTPFLSSAFRLEEKNILPTGLPRCDNLFNPKEEKLIGEIRKDYPQCIVLLYMPTFRTASWTKKPFNPFIGYSFNAASFFGVLEETNIAFLYKPHYYDSGFARCFTSKRFIQVGDSDYDDLYSLIGQVDILMTDYSSVYFDFISIKKPVILAPFDYDEYTTTARELYSDYRETMKGVTAEDWNAVINILRGKKYYAVDEQTTLKYAQYNDGKSCEKLYKAIKSIF